MPLFYKAAALFLLCTSVARAQEVIQLYNGKAPGSENWNWSEKETSQNAFKSRLVYNVVTPTLTAYLPDPATATGTAVIVCPGGAFHILSIDNEGIDVAKWLNARGIAAFVLKYRLVRSQTDDPVAELMPKMRDMKALDAENASVVLLAINDGCKAVEYVRSHAGQYHINPERVGIMGFSAGGTVTAGVAFGYTPASRPAFVAPIYPYIGALTNTKVPADAPPLFAAAATDDELGFATQSSNLYNNWIQAGKPAELHMYAKGGHGFGMRRQNLPVDSWIDRFGEWLGFLGLLTKTP